MTDRDVQLLVIGVCIGVYLMLALQIGFNIRDGRRDRKAARAAQAKLDAARARAASCRDHEHCDRCQVLDPCPCCGLAYAAGQYVYPDGSVLRLGQRAGS
jgi:hypothetical protein